MIKKIAFAGIILIFSGAVAAEWIEISKDNEKVFLFDPELVERLDDGKVSMWVKVSVRYSSKESAYSLSRYVHNCANWQRARSSTTYYSGDGKVLWEDHYAPWKFEDIVPNTTGRVLAETVCAKFKDDTDKVSEFPGYVEFHGELDKPTQK